MPNVSITSDCLGIPRHVLWGEELRPSWRIPPGYYFLGLPGKPGYMSAFDMAIIREREAAMRWTCARCGRTISSINSDWGPVCLKCAEELTGELLRMGQQKVEKIGKG